MWQTSMGLGLANLPFRVPQSSGESQYSATDKTMSGWSELPPDLLASVFSFLQTNSDYIRCRAVCSTWRSATTSRPFHLPLQFPWLAFPSPLQNQEQQQEEHQQNSIFFNLLDSKFHSLLLPKSTHFLGSSDGWLVLRSNQPPYAISLFNPITRSQIHLPDLKTFPMSYFFIKKIILSPPPIAALALLSCSTDLGLCRPGEDSWTLLEGESVYHDASFFNGHFHVVDGFRRVSFIDEGGRLVELVRVEVPVRTPPFLQRSEKCYLVASAGDLLLVVRHLVGTRSEDGPVVVATKGFEVFRLELDSKKQYASVELKSLGNDILFLGLNRSVLLSADEYTGCRGNSIYFLDDMVNYVGDVANCDHEVMVFDMGDGSIEPLLSCAGSFGSVRRRPAAVWVTPSLC